MFFFPLLFEVILDSLSCVTDLLVIDSASKHLKVQWNFHSESWVPYNLHLILRKYLSREVQKNQIEQYIKGTLPFGLSLSVYEWKHIQSQQNTMNELWKSRDYFNIKLCYSYQ